jgi:hypothetical protein
VVSGSLAMMTIAHTRNTRLANAPAFTANSHRALPPGPNTGDLDE